MGKLFVEKHIALAHKSLWRGAMEAENWKEQGTADDLWQLLTELQRIQEALLSGPRPRTKFPSNRA
jgi:hypothetical protein